jgi:hypothetical protein
MQRRHIFVVFIAGVIVGLTFTKMATNSIIFTSKPILEASRLRENKILHNIARNKTVALFKDELRRDTSLRVPEIVEKGNVTNAKAETVPLCPKQQKKMELTSLDYFRDIALDTLDSCYACATVDNSYIARLIEFFSKHIPDITQIKPKYGICTNLANAYDYEKASEVQKSNNVKVALHSKEKSLDIVSKFADKRAMFPTPPVSKSDMARLSKPYVKSAAMANVFFKRNFGPSWKGRINPLLQNMINDNVCKNDTNKKCPNRVLELGCGLAGNLNHFCTTHECKQAVCIEASSYAQFVNLMMQPNMEFLLGDLQDAKVYKNLPVRAFDLVYESWALMYVSGYDFHKQILAAIYKTLLPNGYYMQEGPLGRANSHGFKAPTPVGSDIKITDASIEGSEYFVDHCRMLVKSGHFKLIQDIRYKSSYNMVYDLSKIKHEVLTKYDIPFKYEKASGRGKDFVDTVNGNCLLQKLTDVSEEKFIMDLPSM